MFKSDKPSWFDKLRRPNAASPEARNISADKALEEAGDRLTRAATQNLEPHRPEFKADLLAKIRSARGTQTSSMSDKISGGLARYFATPRFKAAVAFVVLVALVATTVRFWPEGGRELIISPAYAHDNFEVTATNSDSLGVDSGTTFIIKSKTAIKEGDLKDNLTVVPSVKYRLEKNSDTEYKLIPEEPLKPKTVYKVLIDSSYVKDNGVVANRDYSWAFQVKNIFKVMHSIPADKGTNVPTNSGIEFTFNTDQFEDIAKYFTIEPRVEGRFERHGRTAVFVPKALKEKTIYTVTLKGDLPVKGSSETLKQDTRFQFETYDSKAQSNYDYSSLYFHNDTSEFPTSIEPALPVSAYDSKNSDIEVAVNVYGFKSSSDYISEMQKYNQPGTWSLYSDKKYNLETEKLTKNLSFQVVPPNYASGQYILFPEKLAAGYYVVTISYKDRVDQMFLQVTDLAAFISETETKTLVWVNDIASGDTLPGATVKIHNDNQKTTTDGSGVATFDTKLIASLPTEKTDARTDRYVIVEKGNRSLVLPLSAVDLDANEFKSEDYSYYLYTDRQLYLPNDTVRVWGFLKPHTNQAIKEVKLELNGSHYDYYGDAMFIDEKVVSVDKNGSFTADLKLNEVLNGSYALTLKLDNNVITNRWVLVEKYEKPAYEVTANPRQKAIFAGDPIVIDTEAKFFDGTPVVNVKLNYTGNSGVGTMITSASGKASVSLPTTFTDCSDSRDWCNYPDYRYISISPAQGEEGVIGEDTSVSVFGAKVKLETNFDQTSTTTASVKVTTKKINLDPINNSEESVYGEYAKELAPGVPIAGRIIEISYLTNETGEYYDFINKVTRKTYSYTTQEKVIENFSGVTNNDGSFTYNLTIQPKKSYKVVAQATDDRGRHDVTRNYLYTYLGEFEENGYVNYNIKLRPSTSKEEPDRYGINETVTADFMKNSIVLENPRGKFLFYTLKEGLANYAVTANPTYSFTFKEENVPSVMVRAVWFDGRSFQVTYSDGYWYDGGGGGWYGGDTSTARFRSSDRGLKISVTPDKAKYAPGEEVTLKAKVTDKNGQPVATGLNFNLVDEAFYKLSYESANPIEEIYGISRRGEILTYQTHRDLNPKFTGGAEGGGCFLGGTKVLMANGTEKSIETVKKGDIILTFADEYNAVLVPATVRDTVRHIVRGYLVINGQLKVTPEHRVFINRTWKTIGEAKVGDALLGAGSDTIIIKSIEYKDEEVAVYNLHINDKHTYIADGIYVHNAKGGGEVRSTFTDVAAFVSTETNRNGEAVAKFKLPDNITSWRVTAQGVSPDLYAGVSVTKIPVSLPLFVLPTHALEYVVGDKPVIKARAYGSSLKQGESVNYSVSNLGLGVVTNTKPGTAFAATYFQLPALTEGTSTLKVGAENNKGKDIVARTIAVVSSRQTEREQKFLTLENGLELGKNVKGPATVIFSDQGRGKLVNELYELMWNYGSRVDQKMARVWGAKFLNDNYKDQDYWYWGDEEMQGSMYQNEDGGVGLLPYSGSELELTAKIAAVAPEYFDEGAMTTYLLNIYNSKLSTREELILSLYGLAGLDEVVLAQLQSLSTVKDLTPKERLYVALALQKIGDKERARVMYVDLLKEFGEELPPQYRLNISKNNDLNVEATALAAILGAGLGDEHHQGLWEYAKERYTTDTLVELEKMAYIQGVFPNLNPQEATFTFTVNGKSEEVKVWGSWSRRFSLNSEQLKTAQVSNIKGEIGAIIVSEKLSGDKSERDNNVSITREYLVDGKPTTVFKEGDEIEIILKFNFKPKAFQGYYEVVDYLPSGLRYSYSGRCGPFSAEGQKVTFSTRMEDDFYCNYSRSYFARVVNPGEYTAEAPRIQSFKSAVVKNYGVNQKVIIKE